MSHYFYRWKNWRSIFLTAATSRRGGTEGLCWRQQYRTDIIYTSVYIYIHKRRVVCAACMELSRTLRFCSNYSLSNLRIVTFIDRLRSIWLMVVLLYEIECRLRRNFSYMLSLVSVINLYGKCAFLHFTTARTESLINYSSDVKISNESE